MKPEQLILIAGLGFGAYYFTRQTPAGAVPRMGGSVPPVWNSSPTQALPRVATSTGAGDTLAMAAANLLARLINGTSAQVYRSADYQPGYYPDTSGEAEAAAYYAANQDAFAVNPPATYNQDPAAYASTGGWADRQ